MTAAVRVIGIVFVTTVAPTFAKRFFPVKEDEPVRDLRLLAHAAEHSSDLEQRRH